MDDNSAVCLNQFSWSVENDGKLKSCHFSSFGTEFRKLILRSDVELPRQAENDRVAGTKMNELFSSASKASQVLQLLKQIFFKKLPEGYQISFL